MKLKNIDIAQPPITFRGTFDPPDTRGSSRAARMLNLLPRPVHLPFIHLPFFYIFCVLEGGLYFRRSGKIGIVALRNTRFFGIKNTLRLIIILPLR